MDLRLVFVMLRREPEMWGRRGGGWGWGWGGAGHGFRRQTNRLIQVNEMAGI